MILVLVTEGCRFVMDADMVEDSKWMQLPPLGPPFTSDRHTVWYSTAPAPSQACKPGEVTNTLT